MLTLKHSWLFSNLLFWHAILYGLCIYPGQSPSRSKLVSPVLPDLPHSSTTVSVIGKNWALVETTGLKIPILPLTVWLRKLFSLSLVSIAIKWSFIQLLSVIQLPYNPRPADSCLSASVATLDSSSRVLNQVLLPFLLLISTSYWERSTSQYLPKNSSWTLCLS